MTTDTRSPTVEEWVSALDLTRRGSEFVGPCPVCGGDDRFHVREGNGRAVFGCRSCIDGRTTTEKQEAGGAILRRVFPDRGRREAAPARPTPPRQRSAPDPEASKPPDERARRIWDATLPTDRTPTRRYLSARFVWPPDGTGPALPDDMDGSRQTRPVTYGSADYHWGKNRCRQGSIKPQCPAAKLPEGLPQPPRRGRFFRHFRRCFPCLPSGQAVCRTVQMCSGDDRQPRSPPGLPLLDSP